MRTRTGFQRVPALLMLMLASGAMAAENKAEPARDAVVVMIRGADGEEIYGKDFDRQSELWRAAAESAGVPFHEISPADGDEARARALTLLRSEAVTGASTLWLVLAGHGTFDGRETRLSLIGDDLSPEDVREALSDFKGRLVFAHTGSAALPFCLALKGPDRVLVSATKSGDEVFYTRFGIPFAEAIGGLPAADLDQDGQVSVLEAFLHAAAEVRRFYQEEERIATEHAVLDDNGDGAMTRSEAFDGVRLRQPAADPAANDGALARRTALVLSESEGAMSEAERRERDHLEDELEALKARRGELGEEAYYSALEELLKKLNRLVLK
jgi:hypothetical protein